MKTMNNFLKRLNGKLLMSIEGEEAPATGAPAGEVAPKEEAPKTDTPLEEEAKPETTLVNKNQEAPPVHDPFKMDSLTVPEGMTLSDGHTDKFVELINDSKMSPADRAQGLIDLQAEVAHEASEQISEVWKNTVEGWKQDTVKDPILGGTNLDATTAALGRVMAEHGNDELRGLLDRTGVGNHIEMVRFLHSVSKTMTEGGPLPGDTITPDQELEQKFYPNMAKTG